MPSTDAQDWLKIFDCTPTASSASRQLVTRQNVMTAMVTADFIAICDRGFAPNNWNNCVYATRGSTPFKNLAKGATINKRNSGCNLDCVKQSWAAQYKRLELLTSTCATGGEDYTTSSMFKTCGTNSVTIKTKPNGCVWKPNGDNTPASVWIQKSG